MTIDVAGGEKHTPGAMSTKSQACRSVMPAPRRWEDRKLQKRTAKLNERADTLTAALIEHTEMV
jgi:hypothetical protein